MHVLLLVVRCGSRNVHVDVIRRLRFTEEYQDILFSKILGEIKRMRKQCIPGLPSAIEGLGTRLSIEENRDEDNVLAKSMHDGLYESMRNVFAFGSVTEG